MDAITRMLVTLGYVPGCPAAGHMAGGFWHPGSRDGCTKCGKDKRS